jgi:hypothetical protein
MVHNPQSANELRLRMQQPQLHTDFEDRLISNQICEFTRSSLEYMIMFASGHLQDPARENESQCILLI